MSATGGHGAKGKLRGVFVTGTDTEVGKTWVTLGIMSNLQETGLRVIGMKPVASGSASTPDGLRNDDAERILAQGSMNLSYEEVNPIALEPPVAPHIAARAAGTDISIDRLVSAYRALEMRADCCVVEGVGGWLVPLNDRESLADLVSRLGIPVVMVVAIRLGCLNHALLTVESIVARGLTLMGWVANAPKPGANEMKTNITALTRRIDAPLVGVVPFLDDLSASEFSRHLGGLRRIFR